MSRTRMAAWHWAATLLFTVVTTVTGLAITPAVVRMLGDERNGAVKMILDYAGYLALLELGLGGALGPLLARAAGRGDERALRGTLAAGVRVYAVVAAVILVVGLALVGPIDRLIPVRAAFAGDLRRAWLVAVAAFALLVLAPFRALAEAAQQGYRVNLLMAAQALVIGGASLGLAWVGWGITGQAVALVLGNALVALALAADGLRRRPGLLRAALGARPDPEAWRALRRLGGPTLLLNLCGRVGLLTDYLIVGYLRGPPAVTVLFLTQRLAALAALQLQAIGNAAWAGLAELHARGDRATFARRLVELTNVIAVVGVAALAPIVAYNRHFFDLWVPEETYGGEAIVLVAAVNALLLGLISLWTWCFVGTAQVRRCLPAVGAGAAVNLAASVALTRSLGMIGPLLGTTIGFVAVSSWALPLLLRRAFDVPPRALAAAVAWPLAWGLPYGAALWWLARAHRPPGWAGLAAEAGLAAAGFLALAWHVLLNPTDRDLWRLRLAGLRPG